MKSPPMPAGPRALATNILMVTGIVEAADDGLHIK